MVRVTAAGRSEIQDDPFLDLNRLGEDGTNPFSVQTTEVTGFQANPWSITPVPFRPHDPSGTDYTSAGDTAPSIGSTADAGENPFSWHPGDTARISVEFRNLDSADNATIGSGDFIPTGHHHSDDVSPLAASGTGDATPESATPTSGGTVSSYAWSGQNHIDSLLATYKWGGGLGTGADLTYSFGTASSVYISGYSEPTNGFGEFTVHQKNATRAALDYWSNVANLTFTEVTDSSSVAGDLRFAHSSDPSTAWAYLPSSSTKGGDVWVGNSSWYDNMSQGTYGFQTILHEIGHSLGLMHPHSGGEVADLSIDWTGNSVMSYRSYVGAGLTGYTQNYYPDTPMINDVAALQYIYGANTSHNSGDTVYSWATNEKLLQTIWDGGGADTIDWSNQSTAAVIKLTAGEWSELGSSYWSGASYETRTLNIANGVVIENATGGSGNDTIVGNAADNVIIGSGGDDSLTGGAGNDTFVFEGSSGTGDMIYDFSAGAGSEDQIDISWTGITNFYFLQDNISDVGGNAVITLGGGESVTLNGVTKSQLHADDFVGVSNNTTSLSIAALDAVKAEGDGATTAYTFEVTRTGDVSGATDVDYGVTGSGLDAADAADFGGVLPSGTVNFAANETSKTVTIDVAGDTAVEVDEGFTVTLSNASPGAQIISATATGLIQDDDAPPSSGILLSEDFNDGDSAGWAVVDQSGTGYGPSAWSVVNQEAHQASNIYGGPGGANSLDHRVGTFLHWDDAAAQSWQDYSFEATLRSTDNDGIGLMFYYQDPNNFYKVEFDQQRSFSTLFQMENGVETTLATASGRGYTLGANTQIEVTVAGGDITVLRDGVDVFGTIQSSALTGGSVGLYSWGNTGANFDNILVTEVGAPPLPPSLSIAALDAVKAEGDGATTAYTFTVTRTGDVSGATDVDYGVTGSGLDAADAADFGGVLPSGTVNFAANETSKTVTIDVAGDTAVEVDEGFTVTLSNASPGAQIISATATGLIQDDDAPPSSGILLSEDFNDGDSAGWAVVDQSGTGYGPSAWSVVNQEAHQASNIYGGPGGANSLDHRVGTFLHWDDAAAQSWQDYSFEATLRSTDNDGIGLMFYYQDPNNFYKVEFDQQRSFSTLFQMENGVETTLATASGRGYTLGANTQIEVTVAGGDITVLRDGVDVFGTIQSSALTGGSVGLYSWGNTGANFDNILVTEVSVPASSSILAGDAGDTGIDQISDGNGQNSFVYTTMADADDLVADFVAGNGGDTLDISSLLTSLGYDGRDPFAEGYVRASQSGADTVVEIDANGGADSFSTLATLQDVDETDLNATNWIV